MNSANSIQTIHQLSVFIHAWYGESYGTYSLDVSEASQWMPKPLLEFYAELGRLTGRDAMLKNNSSLTPFGAQNFLCSFAEIVTAYEENQGNNNYYLCFIAENQGVCGFFVEPKPNSYVYCVMDCCYSFPQSDIEDEYFMSSNLEEFLIHFALQETVFFCERIEFEEEVKHKFEDYKNLCNGSPYHSYPEAKSSVCLSPDMQNLGMLWADSKHIGHRNKDLSPHRLKELS